MSQTLRALGLVVLATALCAASVRFSPAHKSAEQKLLDEAIARQDADAAGAMVAP